VRLSEATSSGAGVLASVGAALALLVAVVLISAGPVSAAPAKTPPSAVGELDAVRQELIAVARETQSHEETVAALEHTIGLLGQDAEGRQRDLDESRAEQARLLGTLAYLARDLPERPGLAPPVAIERIRGEMLLQGTLPGLRAEAHALTAEIERIGVLHTQIATKKDELASALQARGEDRRQLAELTARRLDLTRRILPEDSAGPTRTLRLGHDASNIGDLIKRADDAAERRDKEVLARARAALPADKASALTADAADPTRPHQLHPFDPPHALLVTPVSGTIARRFGDAEAPIAAGATPNQGLSLAAFPGAIAVAPFDGRVIYAGSFRNFGRCLIIRHGGLYYSLLAGLERIDITADQWVLAGEPVGAMPEASGGALYFELRRDDRPVDPQPWLAPGAAGQDDANGDQRMRE
jgi:septal ring factor EnvC (AmiA/AmiB activator)